MDFVGATRFKPDATTGYEGFKTAAVNYIANLAPGDRRGLLEKPLDWNRGHPSYFTAMYQLLNALQAVALPPKSRIVEVGSGAGWATEIMTSLGFKVDCIEPSEEMIEVAQRRVRSHLTHHGVEHLYKNVTWQCATMEECNIQPGVADAVLYFESFHHVIDEHTALEHTWNLLRPGGWLIILGDSNWIPGNAQQEAAWNEEMAAYGTLESPFTDAYLLWLLAQRGFVDVARHHSVNCLVPVERQDEPVRNFALMDATWVNLVLARKPLEDQVTLPLEAAPTAANEITPLPVEAPLPPARSDLRYSFAMKLRQIADRILGEDV